jgi:hypothetical protein
LGYLSAVTTYKFEITAIDRAKADWNQLPEGVIRDSHGKLHYIQKEGWESNNL